ncbi:hypothetical protein [Niabella aurantiaca]|uniref:hypothetical protein n=1 Tax=Niabella aurantiaca TaxID=379900 RepID=UPI0012FB8599|nr:hypothetical protein [Niabella aurantiaca]
MQTIMTWGQLLTCLFIFLVCYYAAVLALCYRHDLVTLGSRFMKQELRDAENESSGEESDYEALYTSVHELMRDCKDVFTNVTNAPIDKNRLISDLSRKVKLHPDIKGTAFQVSMSNHIAQEASHRLGVELEDDELERIWQ